MSVRKQCNRYRTEPFGTDFEEVLKRGKRFFSVGYTPGDQFMMTKYGTTWTACQLPAFGKIPTDAIVYEKDGRYWKKVNAE